MISSTIAFVTVHELRNVVSSSQEFLVDRSDDDPFQVYLDTLEADEMQFLSKRESPGGGSYRVNLGTVMNHMKIRLIEGVIIDRFSLAAARIWRVLLEKGKLDDKMVIFGW